jgi:hypothetical protein
VHGPLREQREDGRPDVAAAGPAAAAAEPFAPAPPVTVTGTTAGESPERALPRHARPRAAWRERWERHATACLTKVLAHLVELGARVTERRPVPEWMFVSE